MQPEDLRYFDNDGKTMDRYTAVLPDGVVLMSKNPLSPQGVYLHAQGGIPRNDKEIAFTDLPEPCQEAIRRELKEWWSDEANGDAQLEQEGNPYGL